MNPKTNILITILRACMFMSSIALLGANISPANAADGEIQKLQNPMSVNYLKAKLLKSQPRLVLNPTIEKNLKQKIKTDPVVRNYFAIMKQNAAKIQTQDLLIRKMEGRRLLGISREMLYRMNILAMVYRIEKNQAILKRINDELMAVCNFTDWNPSHYLDVAEMSMAVAIALDWTAGMLPKSTIDLAKTALIEKGIKPSYNEKGNTGWVKGNNNWNQVCNGSMIAASIVIAEKDPELASKTISRSLEGMPYALQEYAPDGVYPEGSTYWEYGTSFSIITSSMLNSAFGTDFGLANYPAFLKSADFRLLSIAPSGKFFNFADCGDNSGEEGDIPLAWFAAQTGNSIYLKKDDYLHSPESCGKLPRTSGAGLVWLSEFQAKKETTLPLAWKGDGTNPIAIFRGGENDPHQYYFGGKGGKSTSSHGNMDAGSFIFELNGVRWVLDPGNQEYNALEITGFDLWNSCQDCQRWTLLTKNNFGHSTLTVNNALFVNDGFASLIDFKDTEKPEASFDLTAVYGKALKNAIRKFTKDSETSLVIEDQLILSEETKMITWQLMTTADVEIVKGGAILRQDNKVLKMENLSLPELTVSLVSLYPAPLKLDRQIEGLKRIEIRIPAYLFENGKGLIKVRLSSPE